MFLIELSFSSTFQIWQAKRNCKILATAPSNAAVDLLARRLMVHIPKSDILRYYAPTRQEKEVPEDLLDISNYQKSCSRPTDIMKIR